MPKKPQPEKQVQVHRQIFYPYNVSYICSAFPPRRGYMAVRKDDLTYELFDIKPNGKKWELVYPLVYEDGWVARCKKRYIEPDLVMIDEFTYTTYINMC